MILIQTLLSKKPSKNSLSICLLGLSFLLIFFVIDQQDFLGISKFLTVNQSQVLQKHEYWRLYTAPLIHANLHHLAANSIFFTGLAYMLYGYFGLWVFPVLTFLVSGVIHFLTLLALPPTVTLLGISGVVYFMASFWLVLYFFVDRRHSRMRRIMNAIALTFVLLVPETAKQEVSYLSHAIGYGIGTVTGIVFFTFRKTEIRSHEIWRLQEEHLLELSLEAPKEPHPNN